MELIFTTGLILGSLFVGAVSPGPSFILVSRLAIGGSRRDGLMAAIGMGLGGCLFAFVALLGFHSLLAKVPQLYLVLKVAGGSYLIYLAVKLWRNAKTPFSVTKEGVGVQRLWYKSLLLGFGVQISNPKTALIYSSIFAALLPPSLPAWYFILLPVLVFILEFVWFSIVAIALSKQGPRNAYMNYKSLFDRLAGGILAGLGAKLVLTPGS